MADKESQSSQSSSQDSPTAQGGTAGEDITNMSVGDLLDLANQQNVDVSALNELIGQINANPQVNLGNKEQPM